MLLLHLGAAVTGTERSAEESSSTAGVRQQEGLGSYANAAFGALTRTIRDRFIAKEDQNGSPECPCEERSTAPKPQTEATPLHASCQALYSIVQQGVEWAQGIMPQPETASSGNSTLFAIVQGLATQVKEGFEELSRLVSSTSCLTDLDAAGAQLAKLKATHARALEVFEQHGSELTEDRRTRFLERIEELERHTIALEERLETERQRRRDAVEQDAPQLLEAEERAHDECRDRLERPSRFRERLRELREREKEGCRPEELEELLQGLERENRDMQRDVTSGLEEFHRSFERYSREIDEEAWERLAPTLEKLRIAEQMAIQEEFNHIDDSMEHLTETCYRYCESLDTQWVPTLGRVGGGQFGLSHMFFYDQLEALLEQTKIRLFEEEGTAGQGSSSVLESVKTVLEEEPAFQAEFLKPEPGQREPLSSPIVGSVELQVERGERDEEERRQRDELLRRGIETIDPSALPGYARLVLSEPLLLAAAERRAFRQKSDMHTSGEERDLDAERDARALRREERRAEHQHEEERQEARRQEERHGRREERLRAAEEEEQRASRGEVRDREHADERADRTEAREARRETEEAGRRRQEEAQLEEEEAPRLIKPRPLTPRL